MIPLLALIVIFMIVVYAGKHVRRPGPRSYLFIGLLTAIQVGIVLYFMYTMESPVSP